jgi:DNA (cytosine-5)-methyltransferase 1
MGVPNWEERQIENENQEPLEPIGMPRKKFTWYEFFAGGGMARLGLGTRWNCTFANEWCEKKAKAYRSYFGRSPELKVRDVRSLTANDLPGRADLAWASFPCQDLSLAGSGAGLRGERSGTFAPFWKLINALADHGRKPRIVVLENVVGTITSHKGEDIATLVRTMVDTGYVVGAVVINAIHFVPQSRPRLFVIGVSSDEAIPAELLSNDYDKFWHPRSLLKAYFDWPLSVRHNWVWWNMPKPDGLRIDGLSSVVEESPKGVAWHTKQETDRLISLMSETNRRKLDFAKRARYRTTGTIYRRTRPISKRLGAKRVQRAEIRFDGISGCLRTPVGGSSRQTIIVVEGKHIASRLLSPREAARLMGVPDDYPTPNKYNDAYHLFGDGVVVPVVSWLEKHLLRPLALPRTMERVA